MAYTITDVVNNSAAAQRRREEALNGLDLPTEGGVRPRLRSAGIPPYLCGGGGRPPGGGPDRTLPV